MPNFCGLEHPSRGAGAAVQSQSIITITPITVQKVTTHARRKRRSAPSPSSIPQRLPGSHVQSRLPKRNVLASRQRQMVRHQRSLPRLRNRKSRRVDRRRARRTRSRHPRHPKPTKTCRHLLQRPTHHRTRMPNTVASSITYALTGDFYDVVKDLKKQFKFLGDTGCYFFLYVIGEPVPPHDEWMCAQERAKSTPLTVIPAKAGIQRGRAKGQ